MVGWLNKRDGRGIGTLKKWRKRYYVLRGTQMLAYMNEKIVGQQPAGSIPLEYMDEVKVEGKVRIGFWLVFFPLYIYIYI